MRSAPAFLVLLLFLAGCAAAPPVPETPATGKAPAEAPRPADPVDALVEDLRAEARRLEAGGRSREALERWSAVAALRPRDREAKARARELKRELEASAEGHFRRGRKYLEEGETAQARREFIVALSENPDHAAALDWLKHRLRPDAFVYRVRRGDTLGGIAEERLGDPAMAVIIAGLNDLGSDEALKPGRELTIPLTEGLAPPPPPAAPAAASPPPPPSPPAGEAREDVARAAEDVGGYLPEEEDDLSEGEILLARAQTLFDEGRYEEAVDEARGIPEGGWEGGEARRLVNAAWYGLGLERQGMEEYPGALEAFGRVDPGYREIEEVVARLKARMRQAAEEHYIAGVQFFVAERLDDAVREWEETLALDPDHPKAARDIEKARKLTEELRKVR